MDLQEKLPLLVNIATASRLLGISQRTLWQLTKDGKIPCIKLGRLTKYPVATLNAWIEVNLIKGK